MNKEELKKIIEKGESMSVEFKESLSLKDEIGENVSAFSNTGNGLIFAGVSNSGKIKGIQIGEKTIEMFANYIKQHTDNPVYPKINIETIDNKNIIVIEVDEHGEKPVFFKGKAYKRIGKSVHKMSASEIRELAKRSTKSFWDSQICKGAKLDDINEENVRWFLRKAKYARNFDIGPETPVKEALERLNLIINKKLTNAAVLLFGKNPQRFFLQAETRCARFKGIKPVKPFLDMKVFDGNIIDQVDKSLNFVLEHIPMKVYLAGKTEREEKYEYPRDAVREAIINAVCHRDYQIQSNVQVRIFNDRIEVWGCGHLPEPLVPEDLKKKHKSILRNPLIAKCFFFIKFIEQWGTGTNDMINMCLEWGLPEPIFEEAAGSLVVIFRKYKISEDVMKELNERQRKAIEHIKNHGLITNREFREIFSVTDRTALRDLDDLVNKDILKRIGKRRGAKYEIR